jgi:hypothetical protein
VKQLALQVAARDDVIQHRAAGSFGHFSKVASRASLTAGGRPRG